MSDARYSLGLCINASPEQAFLASLAGPMPRPDARPHVGAIERANLALFSVLTESQQERALQRLGWSPAPSPLPRSPDDGAEPTAAVHDPEPARWQDKAAAWLRAKADEQEARNLRHPGHADAYPSWRERVDQWRALAVEVVRVP